MSDLDSFFAKKDRKKIKGKKFDNMDDMTKRLNECEKKLEKELCKIEQPKKSLDVLSTATTDTGSENAAPESQKKEEEQWNDYTEEVQEDLSNLKIAKLKIDDDDDGVDLREDVGGFGQNNSAEGVWNKNIEESVDSENKEVQSQSQDGEKSTKSSYMPPHMRNKMGSNPPSRGPPKTKTAPDITSEKAFPTLSDAKTISSALPAWGKNKLKDDNRQFDKVTNGPSGRVDPSRLAEKVSTANRFDSLAERS